VYAGREEQKFEYDKQVQQHVCIFLQMLKIPSAQLDLQRHIVIDEKCGFECEYMETYRFLNYFNNLRKYKLN
jgi:hypothetical protein